MHNFHCLARDFSVTKKNLCCFTCFRRLQMIMKHLVVLFLSVSVVSSCLLQISLNYFLI